MIRNPLYKALGAILIFLLIIFSACTIREDDSSSSYDANEFFPGGIESRNIRAEDQAFKVNFVSDGYEVFSVAMSEHKNMILTDFDEKNKLLVLYNSTYEDNKNQVKLFLIGDDARTYDAKIIESENAPTSVWYSENGVILANWELNEKGEAVVLEAYELTSDGEEAVVNSIETEVYPHNERHIKAPNGDIHVFKTVDDGNGDGGIDLLYPDGTRTRILENLMLDEVINGKAITLSGVTGYTPVGFIGETVLAYSIGGWEWSKGYGLYDIESGERSEFLDGKALLGIDGEGNMYIAEPEDYRYKNIWKTDIGGETELIATAVEDGSNQNVLKLYGGNIDVIFKDSYWLVYNYDEGVCGEQMNESSAVVSVYTADFKTLIAQISVTNNNLQHQFVFLDDKMIMPIIITAGSSIKDYSEEYTLYPAEITLYNYSSGKFTVGTLKDDGSIKDMLTELRALGSAKTEEAVPIDREKDMYFMRFNMPDDTIRTAIWTEGYLYTEEGFVYEFDHDFSSLAEKYLGGTIKEAELNRAIPALILAAKDENGWISELMPPASFDYEIVAADDIMIYIDGYDEGCLNLRIHNKGSSDFDYHQNLIDLQVFIDGTWRDIPNSESYTKKWLDSMNYGYIEVYPGRSVGYNMYIPRDLPKGYYRIVINSAAVGFDLSYDEKGNIKIAKKSNPSIYDEVNGYAPKKDLISIQNEMRQYDDSIELLHMSEDVDFSYLEIDFERGANGSGRMSYRIDNSHYLYMVYALGSTYNLNFYLVDIMSGVLKDTCSAECDTLPHIESYTDDGMILSGWRKNDSGESYIDAVYKLSFEDSKIHLETIGSGEYATDKKIKIVSPDGKTIVYLVEVDELLQGYVEAVHPDSGERERIFENVFSEEYPRLGSSGQGADRYDILRYTPIGFISNDVFAYHIGGINWSEGYGTYNVKTGEKNEYLDGMRLRYVCGDKMYLFTFDDKDIYETDISGKRRLIASENAPEGVFNLAEGKHGTVDKVSFSGVAFIVEYKDYSSHIYKTAYYSPDFSEELVLLQYKVSFLNSTDPRCFFANRLTFVKFKDRQY